MTNIVEQRRIEDGTFTFKHQSAPEIGELAAIAVTDIVDSFTDIQIVGGDRHYFRSGVLHRADGFAIETGTPTSITGRYFLHGEEIFAPGGEAESLRLTHVSPEGVREWTSGTGNRAAVVEADGSVNFWRDGDLHRDGGPAVIESDGTERWYRNGNEIPDPWPALPAVTRDDSAETVTVTGSRARETDTAAQTAARLRDDINLATRAGILTDLLIDYKVETVPNRGQDRPEVKVTVAGLSKNRITRAPSIVDDDPSLPLLSDEAVAIRDTLERLGQAYNQTTTYNGTDLVKSKFYFSVVFKYQEGPTR